MVKKELLLAIIFFVACSLFVSAQEIHYTGSADTAGIWNWTKNTWKAMSPFGEDTRWTFGSFFATIAGYRTGDIWKNFWYYFFIAFGAWWLLFGLYKLSTVKWFKLNSQSLWLKAIAGDFWKVVAYPLAFGVLMATPIISRILGFGTLIYIWQGFGIAAFQLDEITLFIFSILYLAMLVGIIPQLIYSFYKFRAKAKAQFGDLEARRRGAAIRAYSEGLTKG